MVKLIALYERPEDEAAFFEHYEKVHTPLAKKVPGLQKLVVNRVYADAFGREPRVSVATAEQTLTEIWTAILDRGRD